MHEYASAIALRYWLKKMGYPRLIIAGFLLFLFIMAPVTGSDLATQVTNVINRFSWNAVLVLAMVPMIHSGCGLNFGIPLGVLSGLLGGTLAIELGFTGPMSFVMAIVVSTPFAVLFGGGYGMLLNKIKGGEMMVATYVGLSSVSLMCIMWLLIPYRNPSIVMAYTGVGLRNMFALDSFYAGALSEFLKIDLNPLGINLVIPTGSTLFFALLGLAVWAFRERENLMNVFQVSPKYMLLGGVIGAFITFTVIQSMNSLGPARAVMLIVISQLIVAYLIELFGMFGVEKAALEWRKLLGMAIAIAGVVLFKWE